MRSAKRFQNRSNSGFVLIGTTAVSVVVVGIFVAITCCVINQSAAVSYEFKAQTLANILAERVSERTFFNGAKRPEFQLRWFDSAPSHGVRKDTKAIIEAEAKLVGHALGLPNADAITVDTPMSNRDGSQLESQVSVHCNNLSLPFKFPGLPTAINLNVTGYAVHQGMPPPSFVRLGFNLIDPSVSNPSITGATQVAILPSYGFQTDAANSPNLGGTQNNNDVRGNNPSDPLTLWAGINASPEPLRSNAPFINTPRGPVNAFN